MKNILLNLDDWQKRLQRRPLAIFLDYDGTLSAIAPTPAQAKLSHVTQEILKALVKLKDVKVAIISGRGLNDLRKMVPVKGLSYVGSHGIEFSTEVMASSHVPRKYLQELRSLQNKLKTRLGGLQGVLLESKPFSLAIHYRQAQIDSEKEAKRVVRHACEASVESGRVVLIFGKKVIEIMPSNVMDKGRAVEKLLKLWGKKTYLPIFIGDDRTDESAFKAIRERGLTVKVGFPTKKSKARYFLNGIEDVRMLLELILYFRSS